MVGKEAASLRNRRRISSPSLLGAATGLCAFGLFLFASQPVLPRNGPAFVVAGSENIPNGAPRLFGYDHSHYTLRCRMALGLKKTPYRMIWVAEDDAETPISLVGKKITPIIEYPGEVAFADSLKIVARVDADTAFGPALLLPGTERPEVDAWIKQLSKPMRNLGRPRYIRSAVLPEFRSRSSRERFVTTHPLPDPKTGVTLSKEDWAALPKEKRDEAYDHYWSQSDELLEQLNLALPGVEGLIAKDSHVSSHGLSYDDISFFSRLRGLTLIKGVKLPASLEGYLAVMSEMTDIPLLTQAAI
ncbi:unnamed protein product [Polarella glacialis]|uniref:GST N-terminal domain-containing protein n=1 Tax=Polarella glacialis TaxID=89957 RepID=A0A813EVS4_POLGL|nr:unnamed protein product [Polarella glacialis]|mmetsp:Transcript_58339/g.94377  ORF Transcript_58339/g.94377 Transcript_58339/m.94377 type:complete len:302 (-) Transcript_58339:70-975(-)|eukprot:CAMPEP_0115094644 /NCGR_PEP_ID=MMETSP0227-20121206/28491_1 /TAXON_ID=89957 /ORGANISM="Polarella glacialis, Strain CCMP 1383" /LENGTH=301 /DNA_ID=CAMNT_0002487707 /DNA_START=100 /DNA_END=1005 /DNA_ORIENTATION=-